MWKLTVGRPNFCAGAGTTSAHGWKKIPDWPSMFKAWPCIEHDERRPARKSAENETNGALLRFVVISSSPRSLPGCERASQGSLGWEIGLGYSATRARSWRAMGI